MGNTQPEKINDNQLSMDIYSIIIIRTNGTVLCQYTHNPQISSFKLESVIVKVIEESRKLSKSIYDNDILHINVQGNQVYYKPHKGVLLIVTILTKKHSQNIDRLFQKLVNIFDEEFTKIIKGNILPNKLSFEQQRELKSLNKRISEIIQSHNCIHLLKGKKMLKRTQSSHENLQMFLKTITERQEKIINSQNSINKQYHKVINSAIDYNNNTRSLYLTLYSKIIIILGLYLLTILTGIYIIVSN